MVVLGSKCWPPDDMDWKWLFEWVVGVHLDVVLVDEVQGVEYCVLKFLSRLGRWVGAGRGGELGMGVSDCQYGFVEIVERSFVQDEEGCEKHNHS